MNLDRVFAYGVLSWREKVCDGVPTPENLVNADTYFRRVMFWGIGVEVLTLEAFVLYQTEWM